MVEALADKQHPVVFLWSEAAQEAFTRYYFRAVTDETLNQAVPEFADNLRINSIRTRSSDRLWYRIWEDGSRRTQRSSMGLGKSRLPNRLTDKAVSHIARRGT